MFINVVLSQISTHQGKLSFILVENTVKADLCTPCGPCLSAIDESDMACQISALFKVLEF